MTQKITDILDGRYIPEFFKDKELEENNLTSWLTEYEKEEILHPRTRKEDEVYRMKGLAKQYVRGKAISNIIKAEKRKSYMAGKKLIHLSFDKEFVNEFKILCGLVSVNEMMRHLIKSYVDDMTTRNNEGVIQ